MADALQDLRSEYADVSKRLTRVAIVTLTALLVAVVAYTRAFAKLREHEVQERLAAIQKLIDSTGCMPDVSYVFAWALTPGNVTEVLDRPSASYSGPKFDLAQAAEKLEQDAASWFTVKFSLLGSSVEGDLRYWILLLPPFLLFANIYLVVTREKLRLIQRIAHSQVAIAEGGSDPPKALDRLFFGELDSPYALYPNRFGSFLYIVTSLGLIAYLLVVSHVTWHLWAADLLVALTWIALILTFWATAYSCRILGRLRSQLNGLVAEEQAASGSMRIYRGAIFCLERLRIWARRGPRLTLSSALALLVVSLLTPLVKDCNGVKYSGLEVLRGKSNGAWFVERHFISNASDFIGVYMYGAVMVLAALALLALLLSFIKPRLLSRYSRFAAPVGIGLAWYAVVDLAFGYPPTGITFAGDAFRLLLFFVPLILWIRWPGMKRETAIRRRRGLASLLIAACLPAVIFAPVALVDLTRRGIPGFSAFFAGTLLLAFGIDASRQPEPERFQNAATILRGPPSPDPAAHLS